MVSVPEGLRIDLHTHSSRSDGTSPPAELVAQAAAAGLDVVALTDHDTADGWGCQPVQKRLGFRDDLLLVFRRHARQRAIGQRHARVGL